jgi:hypothetical protein
MTLHLITLVLGFSSYKWIDNPIEVVEKENSFIVSDDNESAVLSLVPELISKNRVNMVLASKATSLKQITLSIYCMQSRIRESKDKLITEIIKLSDAFQKGFEQQKTILQNITYENQALSD